MRPTHLYPLRWDTPMAASWTLPAVIFGQGKRTKKGNK
jgi:hypothetical protein